MCSSPCCRGRKSKSSSRSPHGVEIKQEPIMGNGSSNKSESSNVVQQRQRPQIDSKEESSMASGKINQYIISSLLNLDRKKSDILKATRWCVCVCSSVHFGSARILRNIVVATSKSLAGFYRSEPGKPIFLLSPQRPNNCQTASINLTD